MSEKSLYERLGGADGVRAVVVRLYEKLLTDPELSPFFAGVNVEALRNSQHAFVSVATGGPNKYTGQSLIVAHARLVKKGLTDKHFDGVIDHFKAVMKDLGVLSVFVEEAVAILESTREQVLGRVNA